MPHVLFGDQVLSKGPALVVTTENELGFQFPLLFAARLSTRRGQVINAIMVHDFEERFVSAIDVFELEVEHRINPVLACQNAKAILPPITREQRVFALSRLAVEVELTCPPTGDPVFELEGAAPKTVVPTRLARHIFGSEFQVPRLL